MEQLGEIITVTKTCTSYVLSSLDMQSFKLSTKPIPMGPCIVKEEFRSTNGIVHTVCPNCRQYVLDPGEKQCPKCVKE